MDHLPSDESAPLNNNKPTTAKYLKCSLHALFLGSRLNILLPFAILAILASHYKAPSSVVFCCSLIALAPLAERLGFVTEELSKCTNAIIGGLLNATFSNAPEMIIVICALRANMMRMIQLSLLGSIVGNLLLCLGSAFLAGGIVYKTLYFNKLAAQTYSAMLLVGLSAIAFPTILHSTSTDLDLEISQLTISRIISILMLLLYAGYIYFQVVSHHEAFDSESTPTSSSDGEGSGHVDAESGAMAGTCDRSSSDDDDDDDRPILGFWGSLFWLGAITVLISFLSDYLVDTVEGAATQMGIPTSGLVVVVLPLVNNVAEHSSAIIFGYRNKLDISLAIALGSSIQLLMFLVPFGVIGGWINNVPMDLNFQSFETLILGCAIVIAIFSIQGAYGNWLKGVSLIFVYFMLATTICSRKEDITPHALSNMTLSIDHD